MAILRLEPIYVHNRMRCECGGEEFFISMDSEEDKSDALGRDYIDNIECCKCHQMYLIKLQSETRE